MGMEELSWWVDPAGKPLKTKASVATKRRRRARPPSCSAADDGEQEMLLGQLSFTTCLSGLAVVLSLNERDWRTVVYADGAPSALII